MRPDTIRRLEQWSVDVQTGKEDRNRRSSYLTVQFQRSQLGEKLLTISRLLKSGCPSAYSYPYDDFTSTYMSDDATEYVVEFWPGDIESSFHVKHYNSNRGVFRYMVIIVATSWILPF